MNEWLLPEQRVTLEGCVVTAGSELTVRLTLDESVGVAQVALVRIAWHGIRFVLL
ncbi:MAG: hypothetical protein U0T56_10210 [Ferruginibacter sp.]